MKTAIEQAEKEISELWSSPDRPTYAQIFEVLERAKKIEKEQIIVSHLKGQWVKSARADKDKSKEYYEKTFN